MIKNYLSSVRQQFDYYKLLGEKAFDGLSDEQVQWQFNAESNSIAVIVNHLHGNMLSRWTDFLTSDGEKEWRNRDGEFENHIKTIEDLQQKWEAGWQCVFNAIDSINEDNFGTTIYIRNMGHTIPEAINRQLAHYPYHIGQIVFIARMIKGENWQSLSIPKGQSAAYNTEKFAKPKRKEHFAKSLIDKLNDKKK